MNVVGGYRPNNKWELSLRWSLFGGKPYTEIDREKSLLFDQAIYLKEKYNGLISKKGFLNIKVISNRSQLRNRKKAIIKAIKELEPNEILLVAGKGHETKQDYGNKIINFSDKKVILEEVQNRIETASNLLLTHF